MKEELVLPADYPEEVLHTRALTYLNEQLDREVMAVTARPIRWAALQIGLLVGVVYVSTVTKGILAVEQGPAVMAAWLALALGIVGCLSYSIKAGRRMQKAYQTKVLGLKTGTMSPLDVLGARLEDMTRRVAVVEPKDVIAEQLRETQRAYAGMKALQSNIDLATSHAVQAPALADTVVAKVEPRRIALSIN